MDDPYAVLPLWLPVAGESGEMQVPSASRLYPPSVIAALAGLHAPPEDCAAMMSAANVTFVFPVAIAAPPLAVLSVIVDAWTLSVPRFDIPPPRPPDVLPAIVELLTVTVPLGWTLIPPPLIGASLLTIAERVNVAAPC